MSRITLSTILLAFIAAQSPLAQETAKTPEQEATSSLAALVPWEGVKQMLEQVSELDLLPPGEKNHERAKATILLALSATSYFKGNWTQSLGLLGTTMLDCHVLDCLAYRSLFQSVALKPYYKLYATTLLDNAILVEYDRRFGSGGYFPIERKSIVFRRESILYALSMNLQARYIYNDEGNYGREYTPNPDRKVNKALMQVFNTGLEFYKDLKRRGFHDKTLRDALGIVAASLAYDGHIAIMAKAIELEHPSQIYSDALKDTLERMTEKPGHSYNFLDELGSEMSIRGLSPEDTVLLPDLDDEKNFKALLTIIDKDLDDIRQEKPRDTTAKGTPPTPRHSARCTAIKKVVCADGECSELSPTDFLLLGKDGDKRTYSRCDQNGCDSYDAITKEAGLYENWQLADPQGIIFKRALSEDQSFVEVATLGLQVYISTGHCEIVGE